ncbi:nitrogen regulation protein NR(II) [Methylococcus sp. EFPC2]|uniref:nitrogen regulation protein NR(II) n=1 Tax=Methylococcus sp. EFPC2 TaxID=2812648 RepID=UPI0019677002|nr:nitrogen regulation protein NR(II) [Methylococcus sp. EFPC2]QSA97227.1 nitrogen regulation protein NR(II) [Methylococcus sp. EFPC2]
MTPTKSVQFYRRILDNLTDAVLLFDQDLSLSYINMPGEILFAVSARQVLGSRAQQVFFFSDQSVESDMRRALATGSSITKRNVLLSLPLHPMTVNVAMTPLVDEPNPALLVELQQVDRHLRISMEEQLMAQQNASRMLLRGLAHEIKNPLGGLRGAAQLLDRELDEEQREYTRIVIEESDRLQSLVDRMLAPHTPPHKSQLNIHKVLERVRQLVQAEAPAGVSLHRDYDPSIPDLLGDSDQLIQAILNIVRNAAQAVGSRGNITIRTRIHRQVTLGHRRHLLAVKIEVIDDGPGIKPELLNQIFYPMVTGRAEGTGLGLSIAQSLISQHGGLVECASVPGNTVFSIFLPLEKEHE